MLSASEGRSQKGTRGAEHMGAGTLDGRLICVCGTASRITGAGPTLVIDPADPFLVGAGFVRAPTLFVAGPRAIDAGLVGEIEDGIVVACRGTLSFDIHRVPTLLDWLNDFQADPVPAPAFPGFVHSGFFGATKALLDVVAEVDRQLGALAA